MSEEKCPQRCPYCGAKRGKGILHDERTMIPLPDIVWFECGTALASPQLRGQECFKTEIAALKSLLREGETCLSIYLKGDNVELQVQYDNDEKAATLLPRIKEAIK